MENTKISTVVEIISVESEELTKLKEKFNKLKYSEREKQDLLSSIEKDFIDRGLKIENEEEKYGYVIDILREFMRIDKQRKNTKLKTLPETICTKKFKLIEKTKEAVKDQIIRSEGKFPGYFWLSSKKTDISNRAKNYIDSLKKGAVKNTFGFNLCIRSEDIDYREIYFRNDEDCEEMIGFIYLTPIQVAGYPWYWHDATSLNIFIEEKFRGKKFFDEIIWSYTNMALKHIAKYDENKLNIDFHRSFREEGQGSFIKLRVIGDNTQEEIYRTKLCKLGFLDKVNSQRKKNEDKRMFKFKEGIESALKDESSELFKLQDEFKDKFESKSKNSMIDQVFTASYNLKNLNESEIKIMSAMCGILKEIPESKTFKSSYSDVNVFEITKEMLDKVLLQNKDKFDFIEGNPSFEDEKNILNLRNTSQINRLNRDDKSLNQLHFF